MLTLTDVLDEMLPQGTRPAGKGPPVTPVPVRRVAILDGISTPLVDRATLAIADAAAPADALNLLSTAPAALVVSSFLLSSPAWLAAGLAWIAHISFDRALGFGLRTPEGFQRT